MYGIQDKQNFQKLNISQNNSNTFDLSYTNIIEVVGDKETDKSKYEYKNKLVIKDGIPKLLFAKIDQTGLSFNKWNLTLGCQSKDFTEEQIASAKFVKSNSISGMDPKKLEDIIKKLQERGQNTKN
mgnify:FL=1